MEFTTRIIKGGALLAETRRMLDVWDVNESSADNLARIGGRNLIGLPSRARSDDVLSLLRQRYVDPGPDILPALKLLTRDSAAFKDACYFESARNDDLLAFSAEGLLFEWWELGRSAVPTEVFEQALLQASPDPEIRTWRPQTLRRVVNGVMSALRDFGILEGKANKALAAPRLSTGGFAYAVGRLRQSGVDDVAESTVWRRWIIDDRAVRSLFLEADRRQILGFHEAGTVKRVEWIHDDLEGVVSAAV